MGIHIPEAELHELVLKRECIPGVERLQTSYCRYFKRGEAQAQQAWHGQLARKNYEQHARIEQQHFLPNDHLLFSELAPESVSLKIVQAPAEFALPVKQDRRLQPSFRVKVDVKYRGQVSLPLTLKAYIVTQHDKDNILSWHPDEATDQDKKKITELKGTTSITHYFEASGGGALPSKRMPQAAQATALETQQSALTGKAVSPAMLLQLWNNERSSTQDTLGSWQPNNNLPIKPIDLMSNAPLSSLSDSLLGLPSSSHGLAGMGMSDAGPSRVLPLGSRDIMGAGLLGGRAGSSLDAGTSGLGQGSDLYGMLSLDNWQASQLQHQQLQAQMLQELQQLSQQQQQPTQLQQLQHMLAAQQVQANAQQQALAQQQQQAAAQLQQQTASADLLTVDHEFEFSNLEFVRPTRMNKVYMVFACQVLDLDFCYVVYNVPTVGICRAEQREKACQKLGLSLPPGMMMSEGPHIKQEHELHGAAAGGRKRDARAETEDTMLGTDLASTLEQVTKRTQGDVAESSMAASSRLLVQGEDETMAIPYSRGALRDWILEQYEGTGLTRKLSELDLKALLSQAGFPAEASADQHITVSRGQWEEFVQQFRGVLQLLQQIANVWNLQEPCIISGFDMDRVGTIQALSNEPAGTFICRFSMSQPGCLVLTCKTVPGHACSDKDNLLHAIIKIDDLYERRVDTWIRDFAGASHVLDVYRQKRVDKRKVFASNYTHLRGLGGDFPASSPS